MTANIVINEQEISSLLGYFSQREQYIRGLPQIKRQTSEIYQTCLDVFHRECDICPSFTTNVARSCISYGGYNIL